MKIDLALIKQIATFGVVGVLATATHYFVALFLATGGIGFNQQSHLEIADTTGFLNVYLANLAGYLCAVSLSYFGHGIFTFKVALNKNVFKKFVVVSVSTFLLSEVMLTLLENVLKLAPQFSLAVVVMTIPILSFIVNKFWVYTHPNDTQVEN